MDYRFTYDRQDYRSAVVPPNYVSHTVMDTIQQLFPRFAVIVQTGLLDLDLNDITSAYTVFVPAEELWDDAIILNMDQNTARNTVLYSTLIGTYDRRVLDTSRFQWLATRETGQSLLYNSDFQTLNYTVPILQYDIRCRNGIIHVIGGLLPPFLSSSV
jgi:hypothetical protein